MKRILFVDDEPEVLNGLRALLRPQRKRWEMVFAGGGLAALAELEKAPFDVIVSDMKMPGMDGATLLRTVQQRYPGAVRIVLSGHSEVEMALRTVPVAHQFLVKPCDPQVLENTVDRACGLQALINDQTVRSLVGGLENLPPLPRIYVALTRLLESEDSGVGEIARVVEQDPALCAKLLQLVNSAFLGLGREIVSVEQAVGYVGVNLLKNLTLAVHVFSSGDLGPSKDRALQRLQRHALLVAAIARRMNVSDLPASEDAFMAGMLHDIGQLVLMKTHPERFEQIQAQARREHRSSHEVELELLGVTHAEIGGYLLGIWGLPYRVVEAVANHHEPARVPSGNSGVLAAVYLANVLAHEQEIARGAEYEVAPPLDLAFLAGTKLVERLPDWREFAAEKAGEAEPHPESGEGTAEAA